jgi:hypothetical protein
MKLFILAFVLLIFVFGCATNASIPTGNSVACPKGITNDPYPGSCGMYVDKNENSYCDLGERTS